MNDWVVETPSLEEDLMNNRVIMLNQKGVNRVVEIIKDKDKEIERLNNIINELEKWVKEDKECFETQFYMGRCVNFQCILDKLQELKGDSSNE